MATLVSLQLVRVAGVGDHRSVPIRRSRVLLNSRRFQGSGLKISALPRGGSLQGGGSLCSPLWGHLLIPRRDSYVRAVRMPTSASSAGPVTNEQEIKRVAAIFATHGAHLLRRTANLVQRCPPWLAEVAPAVGVVAFSIWGLGTVTRAVRRIVFKRNDKKWEESRTYNIMASYMRPILLWIGIILICRAVDPVVLSSEASHIIKQRFVNFVRSLSTVFAFAFCTASLTQQVQRFMMENQNAEEARNVGVQFVGNAVYTSVWIAAVCLFMELLGFSTQKWITAGGFGTVLITLAGREIFTNFLSSVMIHATRPFADNEWIQTKIEGQEVSGTVEHVGWWSPTVIRGDDREAVHIPNHKFSVSVVRNLSQKTHWRIKTHLGISHLDVNKMTPIVADMRKVLAKHPQVEQQRLHRRVFFDNVDSENQALMILVSCFVKTSHFQEYLRVKEIILLDLLKVISHHNARLATPLRSVQRVVDETESRSGGFRDMRNANQAQRRPYLLLNSRAATTSDDEEDEEDEEDDISDEISRLSSAQFASVGKEVSSKSSEDSGTESDGSVEKRILTTASGNQKPQENMPASDGSLGASQIPVSAQQNVKGSVSDDSLLRDSASTETADSEIRENLRDRIHAGTVEGLGRSDASLPQIQGEKRKATPIAATTVLAADIAVEIAEEKVPHLYSNNVGNVVETELPDDQVLENAVPSLKVNINVHSDLPDQVETTLQTSVGEDQSLTLSVNDKHVGVHVAVGDPWTQPSSPSHTSEGTVCEEAVGAASPESSDDPWCQPSSTEIHDESPASSSPRDTDDDLWKVSSTSPKPRPSVDSKLVVPGVVIEGPKHTIPLNEDFTSRDDSRTLVALGNSTSVSKERRESSGKGAASSDTLDREQ